MIRSVVGLAFIVLSASAFGAIRSVTPTARLEQQNKWWMDRHLGKLAAVSNGALRTVEQEKRDALRADICKQVLIQLV